MTLINQFGMTMMRPIILAILEHFKPVEVEKSLRLLVNWAVRFMICGGHSGTVIEKAYSDCAISIRNGFTTNAHGLLKGMNGKIPSDKTFKEQFAVASSAKPLIARYYLRILECEHKGSYSNIPNSDETKYDLEHVMPQKPSKGWGLDAQTVDDYSSRIGNLAIMLKSDNALCGNDLYTTKQPILGRSEFELTKTIASNTGWGTTEIEARQAHLAELAVAAWPNKVT